MAYEFKPMTEEELDKAAEEYNNSLVWPKGEYKFKVVNSAKKVSKNGNDMAELILHFFNNEGKSKLIYDYLVFSDVHFCHRKIRHFCQATGLLDEYNKGTLRENFLDLEGSAYLEIQEEKPNPNGGNYPRRNFVEDYCGKKPVNDVVSSSQNFKDDDILF